MRLSPKSASIAKTICDDASINTAINTNSDDMLALDSRGVRDGGVPGGRPLPRVRRNAVVPPDGHFASEAMAIPTKTSQEHDGARLDGGTPRMRRNAIVLLPGWDTCDMNHVETQRLSPNSADGEVGGQADVNHPQCTRLSLAPPPHPPTPLPNHTHQPYT